jgi:Domain of unknown function (DUF4331)
VNPIAAPDRDDLAAIGVHVGISLHATSQLRVRRNFRAAPAVYLTSPRGSGGFISGHSTEKGNVMLTLKKTGLAAAAVMLAGFVSVPAVMASSHMDAPLISLDATANTADVYAFKSKAGSTDYLTTALTVNPFEEPGIGPNAYRFDSRVDYEIHVALGAKKIGKGKADITYRFEFSTEYVNRNTILQSYLGVLAIDGGFPDNQNLRQTYKVTMIDHRTGAMRVLGENILVPPNNQGRLTPFYNQGDNGDNPAKEGVSSAASLDPYTQSGIRNLKRGHMSFAGQRDDGFYGDIQSIFDLDFSFDKPAPFDSQGGYNVHTIVLNIPLAELDGAKIAGVYATTHRPDGQGRMQVGRQGNPLFAEAFIAIKDKNRYNRLKPTEDMAEFKSYAANPELSAALGVTPIIPGLIESVYIPDLIKVDLTTAPARLAGELGFHRLSVFGGDTLLSTFQDPLNNGGNIPGGWPNGRRFGDDVIDIGVIALGGAGAGPYGSVEVDKVSANDITYNGVFPYAATPLNGRNHGHH